MSFSGNFLLSRVVIISWLHSVVVWVHNWVCTDQPVAGIVWHLAFRRITCLRAKSSSCKSCVLLPVEGFYRAMATLPFCAAGIELFLILIKVSHGLEGALSHPFPP